MQIIFRGKSLTAKFFNLLSLSNQNVWRNFVTLKKTYRATVTNSRVSYPKEAPCRAKELG